jgi:formylglycine-generating enzyme required for sulfatase activity
MSFSAFSALSAVFAVSVFGDPTQEQLALLKVFRSEFVTITPGEGRYPKRFSLGRAMESDPVHDVTFDYSFHIAKYEVPQNLWTAVMGANPSRWKGPRNSAEMLNFNEAQQFCRRATELMRAAKLIEPDEEVRLPSEAEWEYCTRAGTDTVYSFGDKASALNDYAWSHANAAGNDPAVGAKQPNPWGLYDVHGYLWEWCQDTWHNDYTGAPANGTAWTEGGDATSRVLRGGSWKDAAEKLTSSFRIGAPVQLRDDAVGLRCVLAKQPAGRK